MVFNKFFSFFKSILFFCIILSVIFFEKNYYDSYQLAKSAGFLFFLFLFFIILIFTNKKLNITPVLIFYLLYIIYILFRILNSNFYMPSYFTAVLLAPFTFLIPLFLKINLKKFLIFINILVFISCLYGILQFFSEKIRPYSFFGNPIFFAEFLIILLPFIFISFYFFKKNSLFFSFNILFIFINLILSSSRGPLISLFVSSMILFFILHKNNFIKSGQAFLFHSIFIFTFLFFIFLIPHFNNAIKYNIERTTDLFSKNSSAIKTRILTAKVALVSVKKNLLYGNSPYSFRFYFPEYQADILKEKKGFDFINTSYVHNDYLQLLNETGIAGLLLFLSFIFSLFFSYDRAFSYMEEKDFIFATACITSLIAFLTEGFFNFPLFIFPAALLFYLIASILYSITEKFLSFYIFKLKSIFILLFAILSIITISFLKPFDYISNFYLNYGINRTLKYLPQDRDYISKAIKLNPHNFFNYFFMGNAFASIREYDDAINYYEKCLKIYPYSSDILFDIGVMFHAIQNYEKAEKYFKRAIDLYPDFANAHFHLGKIYQSMGKQDLANKEFEIVNRLSPYIFEEELSKSVVFFGEASFEMKYNSK